MSKQIQSVERALAALRIVGNASGGIRLSELARALDMKSPAVCHIVNTLEAGGFLARDGGRIELGGMMFDLCRRNDRERFSRAAERLLPELFRALPHCKFVCFALPRSNGLYWLDQIEERAPGVIVHPDCLLSPYSSAAGLMDAAMRSHIFAENGGSVLTFTERGLPLWGSREKYEEFLSRTARQGYSVCPFEADRWRRMAVPVFNRDGVYCAILGCGLHAAPLNAAPELIPRALEILTDFRDRLQNASALPGELEITKEQ